MVWRRIVSGSLLRDLFDLHAAVRMGDQHDPFSLPVEHEADVELPLDRHRRFDVEPVHDFALGPGLMSDQTAAKQGSRRLSHLVLGGAELDPTGLAPSARMDLRLHRPPRAANLGRAIDRLLRAVRHPPGGIATPKLARSSLAWYSWMSTVDSLSAVSRSAISRQRSSLCLRR